MSPDDIDALWFGIVGLAMVVGIIALVIKCVKGDND